MDIRDFNLVRNVVDDECTYDFNPSSRRLDYHFNETDYVYIKCYYDSNFYYWISKTLADDIGTNEAILSHVKSIQRDKIICEFSDNGNPEIHKDKLFRMYIKSFPLDGRIALSAQEIKNDFMSVKTKCKDFESKAENIDYLKTAKELLTARTTKPVDDYWNSYWLIQELKDLDYLYCSPNDMIRKDYITLRRLCSELYGGYTSSIR